MTNDEMDWVAPLYADGDTWVVFRSAVSGRFVKPAAASADPERHVREVYYIGRPKVDDFRVLAANLIADERLRQVSHEGYTLDHDAHHGPGALLAAAKAYVGRDETLWPWAPSFFKPRGEIANLVRAGALLRAAGDLARADQEERKNRMLAAGTSASSRVSEILRDRDGYALDPSEQEVKALAAVVEERLADTLREAHDVLGGRA